MDILLNTNSVWTGESLKSYQEKTNSTQETTSLTIGSAYTKTTDEVVNSSDTVSISDEARKKQQEASESSSDTALSTQKSNENEDSSDDSATDMKKIIKNQIEKVQKQLIDAQERLAAAMSDHKKSSSSKQEKAAEETNGQTEGSEAANIESLENNDDPTVKTIQSEITQLTTTLATLNAQLSKLQQNGGPTGITGSAGINEGTGLSGGMGERLPVNA